MAITPEERAQVDAHLNALEGIAKFMEEGFTPQDIRERMALAKQGAERKPNGEEGYQRWIMYHDEVLSILDNMEATEAADPHSFYGGSKEDYTDFDGVYAEHKRLMKIVCDHRPGDKWPNEDEFNYARATLKAMLFGSVDGIKRSKEEVIDMAQAWYKMAFEVVTSEVDELNLLEPLVVYNMAKDLPD